MVVIFTSTHCFNGGWNPRVIFSNFHSMGRCMQYFGWKRRLCECYGGCHQSPNWGKTATKRNTPDLWQIQNAKRQGTWTWKLMTSHRDQGHLQLGFNDFNCLASMLNKLQGCRLQLLWFWESYGSPHEKPHKKDPWKTTEFVGWSIMAKTVTNCFDLKAPSEYVLQCRKMCISQHSEAKMYLIHRSTLFLEAPMMESQLSKAQNPPK